jgi:carboxylesterase
MHLGKRLLPFTGVTMFRCKNKLHFCSSPRPENQEFHLRPETSGKPGVLLVHGFTASPWEMRPLGEVLRQAGYPVIAVRLPGHGTTPEDLHHRRFEEWIIATREAYDRLQQETGEVHALGISTGALVLLALAANRNFSSMVLLSPFLAMLHRLAPFTGILRHFRKFQTRDLPPDFAGFYYDRRPVNGVYQICRLIRHLRPLLATITAPTLAINALGDCTIKVESGYDLFLRLGSQCKEYHLFGPQTGHGLATPDHPSWQPMLDLILRFLAMQDHPRHPLEQIAP